MPRLRKDQFAFRKHDDIGTAEAESDEFLEDCYYDRGDLDVLRDCTSTKCIIIGRTGAGKSALMRQLQETEEHSIVIQPEHLSLQYLSNSTILPQLETMGVNLGLFYKLLWRHVLAVELIKSKFGLRTENETTTFWGQLWSYFPKNREREKAIEYLREWGQEFWKDTEYRVREVTGKLESMVKDSLGGKLPAFGEIRCEGEAKESIEDKQQIVHRLQDVVDRLQVRELSNVLKILSETVFEKPIPRFLVLLDKLDEDWVADAFRYRLLKALIETVKEINKQMKAVKVIVAMRQDLLDRVIQETRNSGFQEEKYEALYLNLKWNKQQLIEMLNLRINSLVKRRYSGDPVGWNDVLPTSVNKVNTDEFFVERTMYRPRDLILFFNHCIEQAIDRPEISGEMISHAEGEFSTRRLRSLYDEWAADFPELSIAVELLKKRASQFKLETITDQDIEELCLKITTQNPVSRGHLSQLASDVVDQRMSSPSFRNHVASIFYRVGLLGLKFETGQPVNWSFLHAITASPAAIRDDCMASICPMFYRALGTVMNR